MNRIPSKTRLKVRPAWPTHLPQPGNQRFEF